MNNVLVIIVVISCQDLILLLIVMINLIFIMLFPCLYVAISFEIKNTVNVFS